MCNGVELPGRMVILCDVFEKTPHCFPWCLGHFAFPPAMGEGFQISPHPPQHLLLTILFFYDSILASVKWYLIMVVLDRNR